MHTPHWVQSGNRYSDTWLLHRVFPKTWHRQNSVKLFIFSLVWVFVVILGTSSVTEGQVVDDLSRLSLEDLMNIEITSVARRRWQDETQGQLTDDITAVVVSLDHQSTDGSVTGSMAGSVAPSCPPSARSSLRPSALGPRGFDTRGFERSAPAKACAPRGPVSVPGNVPPARF